MKQGRALAPCPVLRIAASGQQGENVSAAKKMKGQSVTRMDKVHPIVASRPGVMQESLRAALADIPGVAVVGSAGDSLSPFNLVREQ